MIPRKYLLISSIVCLVVGAGFLVMHFMMPAIYSSVPMTVPANYNWCTTIAPVQVPWYVVIFQDPFYAFAGIAFCVIAFILMLIDPTGG